MATVKSYSDLEQSRKLAEILPSETADILYYCNKGNNTLITGSPFIRSFKETNTFSYVPCWSLAALLNVLPPYQLQTQDDGIGILCSCNGKFNIVTADNSVDACVNMIEKLHELKKL